MSHRTVDFIFHAGDKRILVIEVYNEDPNDPGEPDLASPVDLTNAELRWALAERLTDDLPLVLKTKAGGGGITVGGANSNEMLIQLDKADTVDLSGRYWHEAEIVEAGADDTTVATGRVTITPTVLD